MRRTVNSDYKAFRENHNLIPIKIENKESYYIDLINIEHSFSGRVDAWISNTFIYESVQLLINSINLFEMGYFDCAYYSLRQSLELSTTMLYLVDIEQNIREVEFDKWKKDEKFPMQAKMLSFLSKNGEVFIDLRIKLEKYFNNLELIKAKLNKFVHKQGTNKFYVSRNISANSIESKEKFLKEFENYLIDCIGAVAIFRLGIDPFPILLTDDEIFHRTGDLITHPYSEKFI